MMCYIKQPIADLDKCFGRFRRASLKQPACIPLSLHSRPTQFHTNKFERGSEHENSSLEKYYCLKNPQIRP